MKKNAQKRARKFASEFVIVILLLAFCSIVVIVGAKDLYDTVRYCVMAIVIAYIGYRGMSRTNPK